MPDDGGIDLQHLRRFAKLGDLPPHVQEQLTKSSAMQTEGKPKRELFLIAGLITAIPFTELLIPLASLLGEVELFEVDIPLLAPTSQEQATIWTQKYWPTVYKKSNPFGPHPSILERAEEEMRGEVEGYMDLAERVAGDAEEGGLGERVGVVVVERKEGRKARVVAVAGDARWSRWSSEGRGFGNVTAHAVMRAIAMVAEGLKAREEVDAAGPFEAVQGSMSRNDIETEPNGLAAVASEEEFDLADAGLILGARQAQPIPVISNKEDFVDPAQLASKSKVDDATISLLNDKVDLKSKGEEHQSPEALDPRPRTPATVNGGARGILDDALGIISEEAKVHHARMIPPPPADPSRDPLEGIEVDPPTQSNVIEDKAERVPSTKHTQMSGDAHIHSKSKKCEDVQDQNLDYNSNQAEAARNQRQRTIPPDTSKSVGEIFRDKPLLALEKEHYDPSGNENGYLCHELEIYCTHEPCVMCSMAIVHSRFGRAIFGRCMQETGGLCADGELGHGLFWRKELNWTLLAWQWNRGIMTEAPPHLHA